MNYRHGYHAGNFADVVKHIALVAILMHLRKKEKPFAVIDTHAGRGCYDLRDPASLATGEFKAGIQRLEGEIEALPYMPSVSHAAAIPAPPAALEMYLYVVSESGRQRYPGSPLIAAKLQRPADRLVAVEKHPEEAAILRKTLAGCRGVTIEEADGYARLPRLLPPPERRGLILIDPPFEAVDEFEQLAAALRAAHRRFATGIYLVWYPIKEQGEAERFIGEALATGAAALTIEVAIDVPEGKLARSGLLVLNPPYGFEEEMAAVLARLEPALAARTRLERRAS